MNPTSHRIGIVVAGLFGLWEPNPSGARTSGPDVPSADGAVSKEVLRMDHQGPNLLKDGGWQPWSDGFRRERDQFVCDNGQAACRPQGGRSAVAVEAVKAPADRRLGLEQGRGGQRNERRRLLPLSRPGLRRRQRALGEVGELQDRHARLAAGPAGHLPRTADQVVVFSPDAARPLRARPASATRSCATIEIPPGGALFDGVPVVPRGEAREGFQVRDVAVGSDFVRIDRQALGLTLETTRTRQDGADASST